MTLFVDSSVWIDLFNDRPARAVEYLAAHIRRERVVVGDLVLMEVLQGSRSDREMGRLHAALLEFDFVTVGSRAVALAAAQNYRTLRARGVTVRKTNDCLIATRCIAEGWALLYSDRDFDPFVAYLGLRSALADAV